MIPFVHKGIEYTLIRGFPLTAGWKCSSCSRVCCAFHDGCDDFDKAGMLSSMKVFPSLRLLYISDSKPSFEDGKDCAMAIRPLYGHLCWDSTQRLCRIWVEHGFDAIPASCKIFPLYYQQIEKIIFVHMNCPNTHIEVEKPVTNEDLVNRTITWLESGKPPAAIIYTPEAIDEKLITKEKVFAHEELATTYLAKRLASIEEYFHERERILQKKGVVAESSRLLSALNLELNDIFEKRIVPLEGIHLDVEALDFLFRTLHWYQFTGSCLKLPLQTAEEYMVLVTELLIHFAAGSALLNRQKRVSKHDLELAHSIIFNSLALKQLARVVDPEKYPLFVRLVTEIYDTM